VSKTAEQQPLATDLMPPPSAAAPGLSSSAVVTKVASGLVACDHVEARASAH
jgi:hypothetical protein